MTSVFFHIATRFFRSILLAIALAPSLLPAANTAENAGTAASSPGTSPSASMDFLSDEEFQTLSAEDRRRLLRGAWLARIEPTGVPALSRAQDYVDRIRKAVVYDARLTVFDLRATPVDGTTNSVRLRGEVLLPAYVQGVCDTLGQLGIQATSDTVRVLPDGALDDTVGAYGVVTRNGGATMRRSPRARAEQINEVPMGAGVRLLRAGESADLPPNPPGQQAEAGDTPRRRRRMERAGRGVSVNEHDPGPTGWFLAQTTEGYVGFVRADEIQRVRSLAQPAAILTAPTTVTLAQDHPTSPGAPLAVAAGTWLVQAPASGATAYALQFPATPLPPGAKVRSLSKTPISAAELRGLLGPFVGKPYEWGGTSSNGIDCSGLTQFVYRSLGIHLPRDAEEQAVVGNIVAWGDSAATLAQPGDLIFFVNSRGKISHVAVSLGQGIIAHAHERSVKVEPVLEVTERSGESLAERIIFARRILGQ